MSLVLVRYMERELLALYLWTLVVQRQRYLFLSRRGFLYPRAGDGNCLSGLDRTDKHKLLWRFEYAKQN